MTVLGDYEKAWLSLPTFQHWSDSNDPEDKTKCLTTFTVGLYETIKKLSTDNKEIQLLNTTPYYNNEKHGFEFRMYVKKLITQTNFTKDKVHYIIGWKNGKQHGKTTWYRPDYTLESISEWKNGIQEEDIRYRNDGTISSINFYEQGKPLRREYLRRDGSIQRKTNYIYDDGSLRSKETHYREDGSILNDQMCLDRMKDSISTASMFARTTSIIENDFDIIIIPKENRLFRSGPQEIDFNKLSWFTGYFEVTEYSSNNDDEVRCYKLKKDLHLFDKTSYENIDKIYNHDTTSDKDKKIITFVTGYDNTNKNHFITEGIGFSQDPEEAEEDKKTDMYMDKKFAHILCRFDKFDGWCIPSNTKHKNFSGQAPEVMLCNPENCIEKA